MRGEESSPQGCEGIRSREPLPHLPRPAAHPGPPGSTEFRVLPALFPLGEGLVLSLASCVPAGPCTTSSQRGILFQDSRTA